MFMDDNHFFLCNGLHISHKYSVHLIKVYSKIFNFALHVCVFNKKLHCFCAFSHLCAERIRVFVNCEERAEIEEKAEEPREDADT